MASTIIQEITVSIDFSLFFLRVLSLSFVEFAAGEAVVLVDGLRCLSFSSVEFEVEFDAGVMVVLVNGLDVGASDGAEVGECGDNVGFKDG